MNIIQEDVAVCETALTEERFRDHNCFMVLTERERERERERGERERERERERLYKPLISLKHDH
jgi:hypothetical protein